MALKSHIEGVHEGIKNFTCDRCEKSFSLSQSLKAHIKYYHESNGEQNTCDLCNKNFTLPGTLKAHIQEVHKNIKAHQCSYCDKAFKRSFDLKKHFKKVHEGQNNGKITCDACKYTFITASDLKIHYSMVHGKNIDVTFSFSQNSTQTHIVHLNNDEKSEKSLNNEQQPEEILSDVKNQDNFQFHEKNNKTIIANSADEVLNIKDEPVELSETNNTIDIKLEPLEV